MAKRLGVLTTGLVVLLGACAPVWAQDEAAQLQSLVEKKLPTLATVRFLLKMEGRGGEARSTETRVELQGVAVDKDGLLMITSLPFNPGRLGSQFGGGGEDDEGSSGPKATPLDFKIVLGSEEKEYTGFLAAQDTKLNLAFVKIEDLGDRKLTAVEFAGGTLPSVGQTVYSVSRMTKGYDYAPYFASGRVSCVVAKPRKAWAVDGPLGEFGHPIYALNGDTLGALTVVDGSVKGDSESSSFATAMRYYAGGGFIRPFIVPNAAVNATIAQAKTRAIEVAAERAKNKNKKPETKKPAEKKG